MSIHKTLPPEELASRHQLAIRYETEALEREFLKSAYEHNKVSHGHAWYPGDEDYNEYLKRVDADAHKKAQEALDGVLAGARRHLKEEHPELF